MPTIARQTMAPPHGEVKEDEEEAEAEMEVEVRWVEEETEMAMAEELEAMEKLVERVVVVVNRGQGEMHVMLGGRAVEMAVEVVGDGGLVREEVAAVEGGCWLLCGGDGRQEVVEGEVVEGEMTEEEGGRGGGRQEVEGWRWGRREEVAGEEMEGGGGGGGRGGGVAVEVVGGGGGGGVVVGMGRVEKEVVEVE
ncbi:hypothetical protein CYMTET_45177 [Cymbomonas tetramitiformis]|uniref:Uncharacterized protein n=1 Tax=Cymbomonas tetramitiformis TaxID=36881 RepID=A0AAE0EZY1_9CHLO|nr:hypothetical protein CYMTET_45177 [Cymbomonas tetramitiformis]